MAAVISVKGFYGEEDGKSLEGNVTVRFQSRGANGVLSVRFPGKYGIDVPCKEIERLVLATRQDAKEKGPAQTVERSMTVEGFCSLQRETRPGTIYAWVRSRQGVESLTLEYARQGMISVPWREIEGMIRRERRFYV